MLTKWWLLALMSALALSLTSCSSRSNTDLQNGSGFIRGYCDGSLGSFDVYVIATSDSAVFSLAIVPINVNINDPVAVYIASKSPLNYKLLVPEAGAVVQSEINAGTITDADLQTFNILAIVPFQSGISFLEQAPETDAICDLPGSGTGATAYAMARSAIGPMSRRLQTYQSNR